MLTKKIEIWVTLRWSQLIYLISFSAITAPFIIMDDAPWVLAIVIPVVVLVGMVYAFYTGARATLNQIAKDLTKATNNNKEN